MKAEESFYCLYGKQEILFAVGKQYVSANIHSRFCKRGTLAWINRCWGPLPCFNSPTFLFNSFFCFFFFFSRWKWILNIETDYTRFANLLGELSSLSLLPFFRCWESLSLIFIEIQFTRIRLSFYSRDKSINIYFQTFPFVFLLFFLKINYSSIRFSEFFSRREKISILMNFINFARKLKFSSRKRVLTYHR